MSTRYELWTYIQPATLNLVAQFSKKILMKTKGMYMYLIPYNSITPL